MDKAVELAANQELQAKLTGCQQEVEVLRSELELGTAILNTVDAIALAIDPKGHIVRYNSSFEQITGYTLNEVKNQFWELCNQDERESVKAVFERVQQDKTAIAHEHKWITKDGSSRSIAWDYTPCLDSDGIVKYVIGIGNDITAKTPAEHATQERVDQLEAQNRLLSARDRILEATASAANALLTLENFDSAVNTALQIIGESLDTDRVLVIENFAPSSDLASVEWKVLYEWNSPHAVSQISDLKLSQGNHEGIEEWYEILSCGQGISRLLEEMPEPFRSVQVELGLKALHVVPIFVEGKYWGTVGFDDCREAKRRRSAELAVLKIAADSIGSAIQRDRIQRAREEAELMVLLEREKAATERAAELAKANEALKRSLDTLATEPELDKFLGYVLTEIVRQTEACTAHLFLYSPEANTLSLCTVFKDGKLYFEPAPGDPQMFHHPFDADITPAWQSLLVERTICLQTIETQNEWTWEETKAWHIAQKHSAHAGIALVAGDQPVGFLGIAWRDKTTLTTEQTELVHVLSNQATLAIQLTRLAEEAKLAAIAREQEKAAQERVAELSRMNEALQAEVIERQRTEQVSWGQKEALVKTLHALAVEPVLDNFLGYVLQAIAQQLGEPSGGIWLYDKAYDTTILHIDYEDGQIRRGAEISRPGTSRQNLLRQWDADYLQFLQEKKILIQNVQDLPQTPAYAQSRAYNQQRGIKTILVVCLFFGEKFLGNITLRSTKRRDYKPEELELACVLAYQASLAIQLTRLAEQAQQSAVLKERNRIAREIHDTLAQALTGIIVQLQAAEDIHTTDPSDRQAHIATARQLAKQGLTEARRSVQALRPQVLEGKDLTGALANLIEQMGKGTGLETGYSVQGTPYFLSPDVESNLLRIAQEALTNILKHAGASEIQIELVYDPGQLRLRVLDNGQGFDPNLTPTQSYGLIGMQERTQSIGAELTITSQPEGGTEVLVIVPILSPA